MKYILIFLILAVSASALVFEADIPIYSETNTFYLIPSIPLTETISVIDGVISIGAINYSVSTTGAEINLTLITSKYYNISANESVNVNFSVDRQSNFTAILDGVVVSTDRGKNQTFEISLNETKMNLSFNNAPIVTSVTLVPLPTETGDNLTFINVTTDDEGDTITKFRSRWYKNGVLNTSLNNVSIVYFGNTTEGENWSVSFSAFDGYAWSEFKSSSKTTIGDNVAPTITNDLISSNSGFNDAPFSIFVDVFDAGQVFNVQVEITDPNNIKTNFTMGLFAGTTYLKTYTPSTDGNYNLKFYAIDGSGNSAEKDTNLTYNEATQTAIGGGGGGGGSTSPLKSDCDIGISTGSIDFGDNVFFQGISITNNEDISFSPSYEITGELKPYLEIVTPVISLVSGETGDFGVRINRNFARSFNGTATGIIVLSSDNCNDVQIPISLGTGGIIQPFDLFSANVDFIDYLAEPVWSSKSPLRSDLPNITFGFIFLLAELLAIAFVSPVLYKNWKAKEINTIFLLLGFTIILALLISFILISAIRGFF